MKFKPGRVVITAGCLAHMEALGEQPLTYLKRHLAGDWGELDRQDKRANDLAVEFGEARILSRYSLSDGQAVYVITESDRSYTTIMKRDEY